MSRRTDILDDASDWANVIARLDALERAAKGSRTITVSAQSVVDLGSIDGDSVAGVKLSVCGTASGVGGSNTVMRIRPNGSASSIPVQRIRHYNLYDGTSASGSQEGADDASAAGLIMIETGWLTTNNNVWGSGTLWTKTGRHRAYLGQQANQDAVTDVDRVLAARVMSIWQDSSTPITSLSLALGAGTFTGDIHVELIPSA